MDHGDADGHNRLRYSIAKCIRVQDKRRKRQGLNVEEQSGSYFRKLKIF